MSAGRPSFAALDSSALRAEIAEGMLTAAEAVEQALARIERFDGKLDCFAAVWSAEARERAAGLDREREAGGPIGPLHGVPVALKANLCVSGREIHCGSRILAGWRPPYTATAVERLVAAGAVLIGATNMDEFAMGSSGENSAFGVARNPWDTALTPGGSSSGSAAAVAAGLVPLALGSDTGGSVRQPAALCGVAGFKPTYGRVSRYGLVAFGSSLDQIGPFARSVRDLALALGVISGGDERDSTCLAQPALDPAPGPARLDGLRVGVAAESLPPSLDAGVRARVAEALAALADLGAGIHEISLPSTELALPVYYVVAAAEASSNLARYDGVRQGLRVEGDGSLAGMIAATRGAGFGPEVKRRVLLGTYVLSAGYQDAWYRSAQKARAALSRELDQAFERVDVIVGPTSPVPAFPLGERARDPLAMYLCDVLTVPASLAGVPAASVPCGFVESAGRSLPVGLQIVAPRMEDTRCLRVAQAYEQAVPRARRPSPYARAEAAP